MHHITPGATAPTPGALASHPAPSPAPSYTPFDSILHEHALGRGELARQRLAEVVDDLLRAGEAGDLQSYLFASALSKRLNGGRQAEINLYLRQFARSQISLFSLVAQHLPTVGLAGRVANELLLRQIAAHEEVTLLDIGIGTGRQETALLHDLARRGALPERLTVIAIEPDEASLGEAQRALSAAAGELPLDLTVMPMAGLVEELTDAQWETVRRAPGTLVAHGAFAVHHLRPAEGALDTRDMLFARLRDVGTAAVVLCEPNSDHHTPHIEHRFANCWRHFGQTFRLIEQLDVTAEERDAMKMFFAREIEDILANAEESRCERHESTARWLERLRRAGFTPQAEIALPAAVGHPAIEVRAHDGYVGLDYEGETLVSIIAATAGEMPDREMRRGVARE